MMEIYEPQEDSFLLAKNVKKYAYGKTLEIGCGSGIQCFTAIKNTSVKKVLGVDINKEAIKHCRENIYGLKNIKFRKSDMFSRVFGQYDTIICNPPYLPNDPRIKDIALDGGKKGYEWTEKFLRKSRRHLSEYGIILLLISSLTRKDVVEKLIKENLYDFELVERQKIDFEELYVYKLTRNQILSGLKKSGVKKIESFAKGKRGSIFTGRYRLRKVAIKLQREDSPSPGSINNEIEILKKLSGIGIGPKILLSGKNWFIYKFAKGDFIEDFVENSKKLKIIKVLYNVFDQLYALDRFGVNKEEMHNPYKHIIIGKEAILLDFERAKKTQKPKNVTQFCQYLISAKFAELLKSKGINIDRDALLDAAKVYKHSQNKSNFAKILNQIK